MSATALLTLLAALASGTDPLGADFGFLYQPAFALDKELRGPCRPYEPQPGDLILESDDRLVWTVGHNLAKTSHPHHSAIVFRQPDGSLATVQAGGYEPAMGKIGFLDVREHLMLEEAKNGRSERRDRRVWVRQRLTPLTEEQSAALTRFARDTEGRRFARFRLFVLMTPWRAKGPLRTAVLGKPNLEQNSYFCSEYVATALVAARCLDEALARPAAMFPRDLFFGTCRNPHVHRGLAPLNECWAPPARWVSR